VQVVDWVALSVALKRSVLTRAAEAVAGARRAPARRTTGTRIRTATRCGILDESHLPFRDPRCQSSLLGLVELDDAHGALGRRIAAEVAEDALVEVLGDDLDPGLAGAEDVDRADLLELRRQLGVGGDRGVHLDVDEDPAERLGHQAATPNFSLIASGI